MTMPCRPRGSLECVRLVLREECTDGEYRAVIVSSQIHGAGIFCSIIPVEISVDTGVYHSLKQDAYSFINLKLPSAW